MKFKTFSPLLALIMAGSMASQPAYAGKPDTPPGQAKKDTPSSSNGNSGNSGNSNSGNGNSGNGNSGNSGNGNSGNGNSGNSGNGNSGNGNSGNSGNGNSGNGASGNGGGSDAAPPTPAPPTPAPPPPAPPPPTSPLVLGATLCTLSDIGVGASACGGFYAGNLNGGSPDKNQATAEALNALLGVSTYTADNFTVLADLSGADLVGNLINFAPKLYGQTVVSFHVGGANGAPGGVGYNATAFYLFDAGLNGLDSFTFDRPGLSNARLFQTGEAPPLDPLCTGPTCDGGFGGLTPVPEPGTWALMILGFGAMGAMLRRRRAVAA